MRLAPVALFFSLAFALGVAPVHAEQSVVGVSPDDPEMNAAIAKARERLPVFWSKFAVHDESEDGFSLKIAITAGEDTEHFWCNEIVGSADNATCAIANAPELITTVSYGQRIQVDFSSISDWMYRLEGKIVGGETIRVIIPRLSPEQAKSVQDMLADE
jgi:uncharacterized protein YegJ (DUF2314 family)